MVVKLEQANNKCPQLFYSAKILTSLGGDDTSVDYGLPQVFHVGSEGEYNVMVMSLFGNSLEDLFVKNGRRFDLKTTLMVGYQMF